jgi:hypothetical protein
VKSISTPVTCFKSQTSFSPFFPARRPAHVSDVDSNAGGVPRPRQYLARVARAAPCSVSIKLFVDADESSSGSVLLKF